MKTAVSLPDDLFHDADRLADRLGWSRSTLYARALRDFLAAQDEDPVTARLNALADEMNPPSATPGRALIDGGRWPW